MSSLNPVFVLPGALAARPAEIAKAFVASMTLGVGQFCTKPGLLFAVESGDLTGFRTAVAEAIAAATAADPTKTEAAGLVAVTDGATFLAHERLAEEVFGPWSLVVVVKSPADLRTMARHLDGQLTATIHGTPEGISVAVQPASMPLSFIDPVVPARSKKPVRQVIRLSQPMRWLHPLFWKLHGSERPVNGDGRSARLPVARSNDRPSRVMSRSPMTIGGSL